MPEMVPPHLAPWHVTARGGNVAAAAVALATLAAMEAEAQAAGDDGVALDLSAARRLATRANNEDVAADGDGVPSRGSEESLAP